MMKVLITGGLGYIGLTLIDYFIRNTDYQIRVIDLNIYNSLQDGLFLFDNNPNRLELIIDDLCTCDLNKILENIDYVIHLAALVGEDVCKINPQDAIEINYDATIKLVKICDSLKIKKFIFASTCSNYGISGNTLISENGYLTPVSLYSKTKVDIENFLLNEIQTLPFTICRFATAFGIGFRFRGDLMIHEFVSDAIHKNEITLFGELAWRPFIHILDIAHAINLILSADTQDRSIYNIGSNDNNIQKIALARLIQQHINCKINIKKDSFENRNYRVDFTKVYEELGFMTKHKIENTICSLIEKISSERCLSHNRIHLHYIEELNVNEWKEYINLMKYIYKHKDISNISYEIFCRKYEGMRSQQSTIYVIKSKNKIVGTARLIVLTKLCDSVAFIEEVVIDIKHRHQKKATKLIQYLLLKAKELGCYKVVVCARDEIASFYESLGMIPTGKNLTYMFKHKISNE